MSRGTSVLTPNRLPGVPLLLVGLATAGGSADEAAAPEQVSAATTPTAEVVVYRSATCECCAGHIAHPEDAGFIVRAEAVTDVAKVEDRLGVPDDLESCHTSTVGDHFIEGHVPADVIADLVGQQPDIDRIASPGMPAGAPGMPGETPEALPVVAVTDGRSTVFATR